ncbi:MAG: DUF4349 domain-containing protein [Streptosporangiales bacterium]|nr:DUF4349 domain-containing protein [Streptosporangiales bacterium]
MTHRTAPRRRRLYSAVAITLACVAAATACSAGDAMSGPSGDRAESRAAEPADTAVPGQTQGGSSREEGGSGKDEGGASKQAPVDDQLLTYTARLEVRVKNVADKSAEADRIVTQAGGYVENQQEYGERPEARTVTSRFRVPSDEYRRVLGRLTKLGTKTSSSQQVDNVTEAVADVDARVKSANASLSRLRSQMGKAEDLTEVLAVEREISQRQAELESLQARQRVLAKQVSHATITLELVGPKHAPDPDEAGFLPGLRAGWHGLAVFVTGALTVVGAFVPFLLIVVPLGVVTYAVVRRLRRSRKPSTPVEEPADA